MSEARRQFTLTLRFWARCPECGRYSEVATGPEETAYVPWDSRLNALPVCKTHPTAILMIGFKWSMDVDGEKIA